jgi:Cu/Ag efflux protein CusF
MNFQLKKVLLCGSTALVAGSLLIGCAKDKPAQPVAQQAAPAEETKPGVAEERSVVVTATVQKVNRKKRIVTLKFPDGRTAEVKCGPEVRNFPQIQVGDDVTAEFVESVELFVVGPEGKPVAEETTAVQRAPKGKKPGIATVKAVEATATVEAIDYNTRQVTLKGPEGKLTTVTAGPAVKRLNEVKQGDTVVARYVEAVSIQVTAPEKPAKKK